MGGQHVTALVTFLDGAVDDEHDLKLIGGHVLDEVCSCVDEIAVEGQRRLGDCHL